MVTVFHSLAAAAVLSELLTKGSPAMAYHSIPSALKSIILVSSIGMVQRYVYWS